MQPQLTQAIDIISADVASLYEASFPLYERRPWAKQLLLFSQNKLLLYEIAYENKFAGCMFVWKLSRCFLIEHFAIVPHLRGAGIGSSVMRAAIDLFQSIVLETEPEEKSVDAARRIQFYQRLGFALFPEAYYQPPYAPGYPAQKMRLMFNSASLQLADFKELQKEIYSLVYHHQG